MSEMQQSDLPGQPGTPEGEAGPPESDRTAPSVEGRDTEGADEEGTS